MLVRTEPRDWKSHSRSFGIRWPTVDRKSVREMDPVELDSGLCRN